MIETIFFRLLPYEEKAANLIDAVSALKEGIRNIDTNIVDPDSFSQLPNSPYAYWVSEGVRKLFAQFHPFESDERRVRVGVQTGDDFRFVRAWWEVDPLRALDSMRLYQFGNVSLFQDQCRQQSFHGKCWVPFAKGGARSPYYADFHLSVNWERDGDEMKAWATSVYRGGHWSRNIRSANEYYRSGLSWALRTSRFSPYVVPAGCIFSVSRYQALMPDNDLDWVLGFLNGESTTALLRMCSERFEHPKFVAGIVATLPVPAPTEAEKESLASLSRQCIEIVQSLTSTNETSHLFIRPALLEADGNSLYDRLLHWQQAILNAERNLRERQEGIDVLTYKMYGISEEDQQEIKRLLSNNGTIMDNSEEEPVAEDEDETGITTDHHTLIVDLFSYALGCAFGRWDIRLAVGEDTAASKASIPNAFAPLPVCPPGMLTDDDGLPAREMPLNYPFPIPWDGILVDDIGHPKDVTKCVREVLEIIWGDRADDVYLEAMQILMGRGHDQHSWFRTTFFEEHLKRYSKSRRKAPIYWRLATPSNRYALWLYYHRISRDMLYRAVNDYVDPKVRHEQRQLDTLRMEAGEDPIASQRREIETQEAFVDELRAFHDEIARVAPLWEPDFDDSVLINFSPLWRITPRPRVWQKELRETWESLASGKYDWAHLAMYLWPERVIPKCFEEHSLAIAHGLEGRLWVEGNDGKWRPRQITDATLQSLIAERSSSAVRAALAQLHDAPTTVTPPKRTKVRPERPSGSRRARKGENATQLAIDLEEGAG